MSADQNERDWRAEFEIPRDVVFLNHAAFGPVPRRGRLAVEELLLRQGQFLGDPDVDDESFALLESAKRGFARLVGQDPDRIAFVPNTSYGLNAILWGLNLQRGERILVAANEFPAIVYAVRNIAERIGLEMAQLPCTEGFVSRDTLENELGRKPAALVLSWVQYFNGYRYDLKEISDLCHARGCFVLVDSTQGAGAIPLDMRADGFDAIVCGAQKWLFGQTGAGFFGIATNPIRPVEPLYAGWMGYDWGYRFGALQQWDRPSYTDGRFWEVGTYPYYSIRLAAAGIELLNECGVDRLYNRIGTLLTHLARGLEGTRYHAHLFPDERNRSGIVAVSGPRAAELHRHLGDRRIYTSLREGNIRVSPHFYNTADEIDTLVAEIRRFDATSH